MYDLFVGFSVNPEIHVLYPADSNHTKISVPAGNMRVLAGGSAYNVQIAASRAGISSKLFAAVGAGSNERPDAFRETMESFLDTLDVYRLNVRKQDSSLAIVLRPSSGRRRILSYKTPIVSERVAENVQCFQAQLDTCQPAFVVLTGLMPDELELAKPFLEYQGGKKVLSPHVDSIETGEVKKLLAQVNYLFLNWFECKTILGEEPTLDLLQEFCRSHNLDWVSVTTATRGVLVATHDDCFSLPHVDNSLPVVDTTGGGDAFLSGTVIALIKGKLSARTAALHGFCQARLACASEGAVNLPPWTEVEKQVEITRDQIPTHAL